jgi:drug/metabolite transporter (DMT)-like permease
MYAVALLALVTVLYAGYNIFIKLSGSNVPATATTTIVATLFVQVAALTTSLVFLGVLSVRGGHTFSLPASALAWDGIAGICIGLAEIGYLYLFGGVGGITPMAASIAIPTIVSGTIIIALLVSATVLKKSIGWTQLLGCSLILTGIILLFTKAPFGSLTP